MADLPVTFSRLVPNTYIACMTILVYDWMCTLDQEVSYVWNSSWTTGKLLFIINRYLPFVVVSVSVSMPADQYTSVPLAECLTRYKLVSCARCIITHHYMLILMLRTYAIWERRRGVLVFLIVLFLGTAIPAVVFWQIELNSTSESILFSAGCSIVDATIAILTAIRAYRDLRWSRQPWIVQLYQDGMLFYVYLLAISLANILLPILIPLVLHSVLCTRVLLFLRRQLVRGNTQDSLSLGVNHSGLVFAPGSRRDEKSGDIQ
ncbi:hypothetical protein DFH09DRAFT_1139266 [Mycena vulgaris]|nr:hypothetical protein DFH09DRAFT_1139266 [Mycena vulgaris]